MQSWADGPLQEDEIGPITTVVKFDSPEFKAKSKLQQTEAKQSYNPKEAMSTFQPDYIHICFVALLLK